MTRANKQIGEAIDALFEPEEGAEFLQIHRTLTVLRRETGTWAGRHIRVLSVNLEANIFIHHEHRDTLLLDGEFDPAAVETALEGHADDFEFQVEIVEGWENPTLPFWPPDLEDTQAA